MCKAALKLQLGSSAIMNFILLEPASDGGGEALLTFSKSWSMDMDQHQKLKMLNSK